MSPQSSIWVIDDDDSIRWVLDKALSRAGFHTEIFNSADDALEHLALNRPDVIITDIRMPGLSGLDLLSRLRDSEPELPVIVMTAHTDLDSAVASFDRGAFDYLPKPFDVNDAIKLVKRAVEQQPARNVAKPADEDRTLIKGEAPAMQEIFRAIGRLSQTDINVLISGESGTGKELVARSLHEHSPRRSGPFVAINTAAIPAELLDSELFGYEKGAFTGAQTQRKGHFEEADGGTLFLDEIGDMPAASQTRLLRVLSDGRFFRVGGREEVAVNVRIIAATHQNLEQRVQEGGFREDLFHRLNVVRLRIPPLRERRGDIPLLVEHFLKQTAQELGVDQRRLSEAAMEYLMSLDWPGNIRQLENTCRWISVMAPGQTVGVDDLPPDLRGQSGTASTGSGATNWQTALRDYLNQQFALQRENVLAELQPELERVLIETALAHTGQRKIEAARLLGWGRNTLTRKLKETGIEE